MANNAVKADTYIAKAVLVQLNGVNGEQKM